MLRFSQAFSQKKLPLSLLIQEDDDWSGINHENKASNSWKMLLIALTLTLLNGIGGHQVYNNASSQRLGHMLMQHHQTISYSMQKKKLPRTKI